MKTQSGFNTDTVNWHKGIDLGHVTPPHYSACPDAIETYRRDGVALLRGVFDDWVTRLRDGLQRNLDNPQAFAFPCESNPEGEPGRFFDSYCNWQFIPEYQAFVTQSVAASIAGQFMDTRYAQFFHDHAFSKAPGTQQATPWHQDMPYYCIEGWKTASVYVSLDAVDKEVALRFVRGSHRWNTLYYPRVFEDGRHFNEDARSDMELTPDIDAASDEFDILTWALQPGDAIVFDFRTLHGTSAAEVTSPRRAFSTRWVGDDAVYSDAPGETSPPYRNHGMRAGDPLREDWFPVLWRR